MPTETDPASWLDDYGDVLYRYALKRVQDRALAEDLVQDTLLAAWQARTGFAGRSSVKTWLVGILKHKIIDHIRKASRESPLDENHDVASDPGDEYFDERGRWLADIGVWATPERSLDQRQFWQVLEECVSRLPPRHARLFILREVDGVSSEELCKILDVSTTNNLWVMLSRIRMKMRQCLETNWFDRQEPGER
jgi:RNA polymerase sigma-70 factor (ECF subfamily)